MIKCGWASIGENGKATGGKAGDQTGKEVKVGEWYQFKQKMIFRFKDRKLAKKYAEYFEKVCKNELVGYNQTERTSFYMRLKTVDWKLDKLAEKCNCDCSSLTATVLNAIGIEVNPNMTTATMENILKATGKFTILKDEKYLSSDKHLLTGDIINAPNKHTISVLEVREDSKEIEEVKEVAEETTAVLPAKGFKKSIAGAYTTTADLNLRRGAGKQYKVLKVLKENTKVRNHGYFTEVGGTKWLLVAVGDETGFCSEKYLKRV